MRPLPSPPSQLPLWGTRSAFWATQTLPRGGRPRPHHDVRCPPLSSTSRARSFWLLPRATRAWRCVVLTQATALRSHAAKSLPGSRGEVQSHVMDMAANSICLLASVSVGVSVRMSVRLSGFLFVHRYVPWLAIHDSDIRHASPSWQRIWTQVRQQHVHRRETGTLLDNEISTPQ